MGFSWIQMTVPFLSLLAQTLVYATLALVLSMLLPSRNLAAMVAGVFMFASYLVSSLASMNERLEALSKFMPYHYFQTVLSFQDLNLTWLFVLLGVSVIMVTVAWLRFVYRDIRLSGEGSWRLRLTPKSRQST